MTVGEKLAVSQQAWFHIHSLLAAPQPGRGGWMQCSCSNYLYLQYLHPGDGTKSMLVCWQGACKSIKGMIAWSAIPITTATPISTISAPPPLCVLDGLYIRRTAGGILPPLLLPIPAESGLLMQSVSTVCACMLKAFTM